MSKYSLSLLSVVLLSLAAATSAFAADDGNTQPKLNSATVTNSSSPQDLVGTTNGAGNVKGIDCTSLSSSAIGLAHIDITVNGGTAQSIFLSNTVRLEDSASNFYTGWIPMNVRFTSSIRVQLYGSSASAVTCVASWALD